MATWKDTLQDYVDKAKTTISKASHKSDAPGGQDATTATPDATSAGGSDVTATVKHELDKIEQGGDGKQKEPSRSSLEVPESSTKSKAMSRSPSASSMITKYKERLRTSIPAGQFDIENATAVPLNISLNQVGPLYYDTVKPGEIFSRTTGKVWFTIEVRLHLGPASEYGKWSVAWPIMLMAGPSAAAISLAAIPLIVLATGTASIGAITSAAVEGVSAAFSSVATALGVANRLPFASKYRSKAITAAKSQASDAQNFASQVITTLREKGGVSGVLEEWKRKGGEPKLIEMPEQPTSVHDITGADLALVFDVKGAGPTGWKKKRWNALKQALEECKLVDRGWFAGREPVLRVVGGPRIVQVENPFPKTPGELRTILEIFPLKLEKVVEVSENQEPIVEEVARGEGEAKGVQETVRKAAEAIREDEQA